MMDATLREHQSHLLSMLTITATQRLRAETFLIEEDGGVRQVRMARVGDVVLLASAPSRPGFRAGLRKPPLGTIWTRGLTGPYLSRSKFVLGNACGVA